MPEAGFGSNHGVGDFLQGEIREAAVPLHEIGGRGARGQFHMVRSGFEHRLGIEDVGILGFLGESDTGACQHKGRSNQTTLTAKRLFILCPAPERFEKSLLPTGKRGDLRGATEQSALSNILVEWQQQVKRIAEIVCLIFQRYHGSIATAKGCNFQQAPSRLGHGHHRSIAINGVPGCGEVPLPSLFLCRLLAGGGES